MRRSGFVFASWPQTVRNDQLSGGYFLEFRVMGSSLDPVEEAVLGLLGCLEQGLDYMETFEEETRSLVMANAERVVQGLVRLQELAGLVLCRLRRRWARKRAPNLRCRGCGRCGCRCIRRLCPDKSGLLFHGFVQSPNSGMEFSGCVQGD
jgi:hypothetical protein